MRTPKAATDFVHSVERRCLLCQGVLLPILDGQVLAVTRIYVQSLGQTGVNVGGPNMLLAWLMCRGCGFLAPLNLTALGFDPETIAKRSPSRPNDR